MPSYFEEKRGYLDEFSPELFQILADRKITQVQLARAAGWPRGTVAAWLAGTNRIRPDDADHLLDTAHELAGRKSCTGGA